MFRRWTHIIISQTTLFGTCPSVFFDPFVGLVTRRPCTASLRMRRRSRTMLCDGLIQRQSQSKTCQLCSLRASDDRSVGRTVSISDASEIVRSVTSCAHPMQHQSPVCCSLVLGYSRSSRIFLKRYDAIQYNMFNMRAKNDESCVSDEADVPNRLCPNAIHPPADFNSSCHRCTRI